MEEHILEVIKAINEPFEDGKHKLEDVHFESGSALHSKGYYYAKGYFENTENCTLLCKILCKKLQALNISAPTTLIGFRNYTGLLLDMVTKAQSGYYNYAIIEYDNENFTWQHTPEFKENILIILPITSSFNGYLRLRKYIQNYLKQERLNSRIQDYFICMFLVLDDDIRKCELPVTIRDIDETQKIKDLYTYFNWIRIEIDRIKFRSPSNGNNSTSDYVAFPLIKLYCELYLPETCKLCFPSKLIDEKVLYPVHRNNETPNLIEGLPNFPKAQSKEDTIDITQPDWYEAFSPIDSSGEYDIHHYGHIEVNQGHYQHYIQGDQFYAKNRSKIFDFFQSKIDPIIADAHVLFITAENKHNSNFLEDICSYLHKKGNNANILRFKPSDEFVENFISLHSKKFQDKNLRIIYFEEVMSAGATFKLLSDIIRHSRTQNETRKDAYNTLNSFDCVFTLVDRTLPFTKQEILRKLYSAQNPPPESQFIAYIKLNVPVFSAAHMENPALKRIKELGKMIQQCHWDTLKQYIWREKDARQPKHIHEATIHSYGKGAPAYFPFASLSSPDARSKFDLYKGKFNNMQANLIVLFLTHQINTLITGIKLGDDLVTNLTHKIINFNQQDLLRIFRDTPQPDNFLSETEKQIVEDITIKVLTSHPFLYYRKFNESIFSYIIRSLDEMHLCIEKKAIQQFETFRRLKFFIRRSVELNSNFIISVRFLNCLKNQYRKERVEWIKKTYADKVGVFNTELNKKDTSKEFLNAAISQLNYQANQVCFYFSFLLFCYKELIYRNPYRSLKLEQVLRHPSVSQLTDENGNKIEDISKLITSPFFHFIIMLRAENIHLLNELKELHKVNIKNGEKVFEDDNDYRREYFNESPMQQYGDLTIINAQKFLKQSRTIDAAEQIDLGENGIYNWVIQILKIVTRLENKKKRTPVIGSTTRGGTFKTEIKEILGDIINIFKPVHPETNGKLDYAFFVEFRERENDEQQMENIYSIFSQDTDDSPDVIDLPKSGLLYNMLYGLYDSPDLTNSQTLITLIKQQGAYLSFQDQYFAASQSASCKTSELFENDLSHFKDINRYKLFEDATMIHVFRLAGTSTIDQSNGNYLKGQAVLVITSTMPSIVSNFLDFINEERLRLLLLLRDELLEYLQKQFDNDAFIEVLESTKAQIFQKKLRHGINDYLFAQRRLLSKIQNANTSERAILTEEFNMIHYAIMGQINAHHASPHDKKISVTREDFIRRIQVIFNSMFLGEFHISMNEVNIEQLNFLRLEIHPLVYNTVITELIINMKRHCPRRSEKKLRVQYIVEENTFVFENVNKYYPRRKSNDGRMGMKMCMEVADSVGDSISSVNGETYRVELKMKQL